MPRLPEVLNRDQLPAEHRDMFDYLTQTRGSVRVPFSLILNSPEACRRISHLGTYLRFESSIPNAVTELATLTVAREWNCAHEWAQHTRFAREAGVSEAAIDAIGHGGSLEGLNESEALPVRYARELLETGRVSDEAFSAARKQFGDQGAVDLTATIGYYCLMACLLNALEVIPPLEATQLPELSRSA
jgi:4-carboxymuconolactone decarboxylase